MLSHKGMERQNNDDKVYASKELGLWILSDGVGGLKQGEQASQYAVDQITKSIHKGLTLEAAVHSAHSVIKAFNRHETENRGATVVTVLTKNDHYDVAWVGDSRAYLWNSEEQTLRQLTEDHTLVQKLVNAGLLSQEDAINHPKSHVITQCLGIENDHQLNIGKISHQWQFGDQLLLASDGLYNELSEQEIIHAMKLNRDNQAKVEYMVELACKNGGNDNISLILLSSPIMEKAKNNKNLGFLSKIKSMLNLS